MQRTYLSFAFHSRESLFWLSFFIRWKLEKIWSTFAVLHPACSKNSSVTKLLVTLERNVNFYLHVSVSLWDDKQYDEIHGSFLFILYSLSNANIFLFDTPSSTWNFVGKIRHHLDPEMRKMLIRDLYGNENSSGTCSNIYWNLNSIHLSISEIKFKIE